MGRLGLLRRNTNGPAFSDITSCNTVGLTPICSVGLCRTTLEIGAFLDGESARLLSYARTITNLLTLTRSK